MPLSSGMVNNNAPPHPVAFVAHVGNGKTNGTTTTPARDPSAGGEEPTPTVGDESSRVVLRKAKPPIPPPPSSPAQSKQEALDGGGSVTDDATGHDNGAEEAAGERNGGNRECCGGEGKGPATHNESKNSASQVLPPPATKSTIGPSPLSLHSISSGELVSSPNESESAQQPNSVDVKLRPKKPKPKPKPPTILVTQHSNMEIKEVAEGEEANESVAGALEAADEAAPHDANGTENGHAAAEAADEVGEMPTYRVNGVDETTAALLHRTMEALHQANPDFDANTEEIRRLDSQLDNLNKYMDRVEQRLKEHNDKLMETLRQQREEREKRRRSFHERLEANQKEDDDFQRQLAHVLSRVDISRNRNSLLVEEATPADEAPTEPSTRETHVDPRHGEEQ